MIRSGRSVPVVGTVNLGESHAAGPPDFAQLERHFLDQLSPLFRVIIPAADAPTISSHTKLTSTANTLLEAGAPRCGDIIGRIHTGLGDCLRDSLEHVPLPSSADEAAHTRLLDAFLFISETFAARVRQIGLIVRPLEILYQRNISNRPFADTCQDILRDILLARADLCAGLARGLGHALNRLRDAERLHFRLHVEGTAGSFLLPPDGGPEGYPFEVVFPGPLPASAGGSDHVVMADADLADLRSVCRRLTAVLAGLGLFERAIAPEVLRATGVYLQGLPRAEATCLGRFPSCIQPAASSAAPAHQHGGSAGGTRLSGEGCARLAGRLAAAFSREVRRAAAGIGLTPGMADRLRAIFKQVLAAPDCRATLMEVGLDLMLSGRLLDGALVAFRLYRDVAMVEVVRHSLASYIRIRGRATLTGEPFTRGGLVHAPRARPAEDPSGSAPVVLPPSRAFLLEEFDKVTDLANLRQHALSLCNWLFDSHPSLIGVIRSSFEYLMNIHPESMARLLAEYLDITLSPGSAAPPAHWDWPTYALAAPAEFDTDPALILFRYLQAKDVFEQQYRHYLSRRLLTSHEAIERSELAALSLLRVEAGEAFTEQLDSMMADFTGALDLNRKYHKESPRSPAPGACEITVLAVPKAWALKSMPTLALQLPASLLSQLEAFEAYFSNPLAPASGNTGDLAGAAAAGGDAAGAGAPTSGAPAPHEYKRRLVWCPSSMTVLAEATRWWASRPPSPEGAADSPCGRRLALSLHQALALLAFNGGPSSGVLSFADLLAQTGLVVEELALALSGLASPRADERRRPLLEVLAEDDGGGGSGAPAARRAFRLHPGFSCARAAAPLDLSRVVFSSPEAAALSMAEGARTPSGLAHHQSPGLGSPTAGHLAPAAETPATLANLPPDPLYAGADLAGAAWAGPADALAASGPGVPASSGVSSACSSSSSPLLSAEASVDAIDSAGSRHLFNANIFRIDSLLCRIMKAERTLSQRELFERTTAALPISVRPGDLLARVRHLVSLEYLAISPESGEISYVS
ncbi:hypothetical protein H696_00799 [Fonticula alba]|uniref:Cullin family profile domain-containing protein n=1 Tax=Fonticula alba TaxID=691883 RepID=A0A058ZH44_FONAL|nr:hypothetical protein H696_00799 [Fonticula alba]KCV73258.1 hypothetical protein H696_00799 [Fonticula alba]|eukprot:XP_009492959.1 hypothetical protein H696_00799 [Fonticula alba]